VARILSGKGIGKGMGKGTCSGRRISASAHLFPHIPYMPVKHDLKRSDLLQGIC